MQHAFWAEQQPDTSPCLSCEHASPALPPDCDSAFQVRHNPAIGGFDHQDNTQKGTTYIRTHARCVAHAVRMTAQLHKVVIRNTTCQGAFACWHAGQADTSPNRAGNKRHPVGSHRQAKFTAYVQCCLLLHCLTCLAAAGCTGERKDTPQQQCQEEGQHAATHLYLMRADCGMLCAHRSTCSSTCAWCASVGFVQQLLLSPA
jgi:hypothetical protein